MTRKYCRCGHAIDVDHKYILMPMPKYYDGEKSSPTYGQRLTDRCPGCGESIYTFRDEGFLLDAPPIDATLLVAAEKDKEIERLEARVAELQELCGDLAELADKQRNQIATAKHKIEQSIIGLSLTVGPYISVTKDELLVWHQELQDMLEGGK